MRTTVLLSMYPIKQWRTYPFENGKKSIFLQFLWFVKKVPDGEILGWCQDNGNRPNQESKFDLLATRQQLGKIDEGQQKIKIVRTNRQSNLCCSCQSIFSLSRHLPSEIQLRHWVKTLHAVRRFLAVFKGI